MFGRLMRELFFATIICAAASPGIAHSAATGNDSGGEARAAPPEHSRRKTEVPQGKRNDAARSLERIAKGLKKDFGDDNDLAKDADDIAAGLKKKEGDDKRLSDTDALDRL